MAPGHARQRGAVLVFPQCLSGNSADSSYRREQQFYESRLYEIAVAAVTVRKPQFYYIEKNPVIKKGLFFFTRASLIFSLIDISEKFITLRVGVRLRCVTCQIVRRTHIDFIAKRTILCS